MSIQLYHYWRSSASWRVRWGLEIKKIPHEKISVNLLAAVGEQFGLFIDTYVGPQFNF